MKLSVRVLQSLCAKKYSHLEANLAKEVTLPGRLGDDEGGEDTGYEDDAV